jgi:hypothetical protein
VNCFGGGVSAENDKASQKSSLSLAI